MDACFGGLLLDQRAVDVKPGRDAAARGHKQRPRGGEIYGTGDFVFVSNYEQRLQDRFLAGQAEVKSAKERKEGLASTYSRLLDEEAELKKRESLQATKLETLSIGDAMREYQSVQQQLADVGAKYNERLAGALKDLDSRYDNQTRRYETEIEKLDKALRNKILAEKEAEMEIYRRQLDGIMNQTYTVPTTKVELGKYSPEFQAFPVIASIQVNNQPREFSFSIKMPGNEARALWNDREFIRGEGVLKLGQGSNNVTVTSIDIIDDVHSRRYSANGASIGEIKRDGIFVLYGNGIVRNMNTGVEWKVGPDKDTTWDEAKSWVQGLNIAGGGWTLRVRFFSDSGFPA